MFKENKCCFLFIESIWVKDNVAEILLTWDHRFFWNTLSSYACLKFPHATTRDKSLNLKTPGRDNHELGNTPRLKKKGRIFLWEVEGDGVDVLSIPLWCSLKCEGSWYWWGSIFNRKSRWNKDSWAPWKTHFSAFPSFVVDWPWVGSPRTWSLSVGDGISVNSSWASGREMFSMGCRAAGLQNLSTQA